MPSTRRSVLVTIGSASTIPVVGCVGTATGPLPVDAIALRQSFEWLQAGAHWRGVTVTDRQLVFVEIPESAGVANRSDVSLVVGDRNVEPSEEIAGVDTDAIAWHRQTDGIEPMYAIPSPIDAEYIAVRAAGGSDHEVCQAIVDRLHGPPRLQVTRFEAVDTGGEESTVAIVIENSGGHDAVFRANLGSTLLSGLERVDFQVPAGEQRVFTRTVNRFRPDGAETIRLDWGEGATDVQVSPVD